MKIETNKKVVQVCVSVRIICQNFGIIRSEDKKKKKKKLDTHKKRETKKNQWGRMQELTRFLLSKTFLRSFATTLALDRSQLKGKLVSVVSGFGKNRQIRDRPGRFGDDAYFIASRGCADVIGKIFS